MKVKLLSANQKLESKEKELSDTRNSLHQIVKDTKRGMKREIINEKDIGKAITILDKYSITPYFPIAKTMQYDKYFERFELGDTVLYNGKTWRITSKSYQPKNKFGLVNIDNEDKNEKIEVDINDDNDKKIEDLDLERERFEYEGHTYYK